MGGSLLWESLFHGWAPVQASCPAPSYLANAGEGWCPTLSRSGLLRHPGIIAGGFLALGFLSVMNSAYTYVLDAIKGDLTLSYTESGALMSAYFVGYTIGQIPWGLLADRFGSRRVIALSVFGASVSTVAFGSVPSFATAIAARFLTGLLGAGIFVPSVRLIAEWYESRERGTALGLFNVGSSAGQMAVTWSSPLLALFLGWRLGIAIQGSIGVAFAGVIWFLLKDRPKEKSPSNVRKVTGALRTRGFWFLAVVQFVRLGGYYTFLAWLPLVLREDYGLDVIIAGTALSLFNIAGMISNPGGGILADRVGERPVLFGTFALTALGIIAFLYVPAGPALFAIVFVLGWLASFTRAPSFTIIPRLFGTEVAGSLSGIQNVFGSLGALILPLMLGFVRDSTSSYTFGWTALCALEVTASGLLVILSVKK